MMAANNLNVFDVQNHLKHHASHGFDLTHPRGVVIHGKLYPTLNKNISHINYQDGTGLISSVEIPLESGNILNLAQSKGTIPSRIDNVIYANLIHPVTVPAETKNDSVLHHYSILRSSREDGGLLHRLTEDNAHEKIKELMDAPSSGQIWPSNQDEDILKMSSSDYMEHARAFNDAEQLHNNYISRLNKTVNVEPSGGLEYHHAHFDKPIEVPRGHIYVNSLGYKSDGTSIGATQHYAYDPVNETLKRAEVSR